MTRETGAVACVRNFQLPSKVLKLFIIELKVVKLAAVLNPSPPRMSPSQFEEFKSQENANLTLFAFDTKAEIFAHANNFPLPHSR